MEAVRPIGAATAQIARGDRMSQINVNPAGSGGDRSGAAAINMVTVIVVLAVLVVVGWWLFTAGPFGAGGSAGTKDVNVNVNVPKVEQPTNQQPAPPPSKP
jgi:hypothetical protein